MKDKPVQIVGKHYYTKKTCKLCAGRGIITIQGWVRSGQLAEKNIMRCKCCKEVKDDKSTKREV